MKNVWVWSAWVLPLLKPEGSPVQYGDMQQGFIRRTNNVVLALGMQVSMEAIEDCL